MNATQKLMSLNYTLKHGFVCYAVTELEQLGVFNEHL